LCAFARKLRGVDHLGVDVLQVRLVCRPLGCGPDLLKLLVEQCLVEPFHRVSFSAIARRGHGRVGGTAGQGEQCCCSDDGYCHLCWASHHLTSLLCLANPLEGLVVVQDEPTRGRVQAPSPLREKLGPTACGAPGRWPPNRRRRGRSAAPE